MLSTYPATEVGVLPLDGLGGLIVGTDVALEPGVPYLGTMGGNTRVALTLFDRAASLDAPDWPPVLRAWMVGCRAEEHAALGHALNRTAIWSQPTV